MKVKPGLVMLYQRRFTTAPFEQLVQRMRNVETSRTSGGWRISRDGVGILLTQQVEPKLVAQIQALIRQNSKIDPAILARCDAVIGATWPDGADVAELQLEASYLEEEVRGVTAFMTKRSVSAGSFPPGAGDPVPGEPLDPEALRARLLGTWRLARDEPCAVAPPGELALTITRAGELVYTKLHGMARIQLVYRIDGGDLITDQPIAPREQRTPISLDEDGRLYLFDFGGPTVFVREEPAEIADPDAALSALSGFALRHAISSTGPGAPLVPFVVTEGDDGGRSLERFVTTTELARSAAETGVRRRNPAMYAFAFDGFATLDGQKTDAIIVEAGRRGQPRGPVFLQPYAFRDGRAVATGPQHASGDAAAWLLPS